MAPGGVATGIPASKSLVWRPGTGIMEADDLSSQSNPHSTIGTRQTEYHEALPSSQNVQSHLTSSFADDGNASRFSVCRVPMVEWGLDCEECRHLTVVGLHDTSPRSSYQWLRSWYSSGNPARRHCAIVVGLHQTGPRKQIQRESHCTIVFGFHETGPRKQIQRESHCTIVVGLQQTGPRKQIQRESHCTIVFGFHETGPRKQIQRESHCTIVVGLQQTGPRKQIQRESHCTIVVGFHETGPRKQIQRESGNQTQSTALEADALPLGQRGVRTTRTRRSLKSTMF